jgi:hypothetical protein
LENATTDGVVREPSALAMTVGSPPWGRGTRLLVVPCFLRFAVAFCVLFVVGVEVGVGLGVGHLADENFAVFV